MPEQSIGVGVRTGIGLNGNRISVRLVTGAGDGVITGPVMGTQTLFTQ
jgi:hypothetical protein